MLHERLHKEEQSKPFKSSGQTEELQCDNIYFFIFYCACCHCLGICFSFQQPNVFHDLSLNELESLVAIYGAPHESETSCFSLCFVPYQKYFIYIIFYFQDNIIFILFTGFIDQAARSQYGWYALYQKSSFMTANVL